MVPSGVSAIRTPTLQPVSRHMEILLYSFETALRAGASAQTFSSGGSCVAKADAAVYKSAQDACLSSCTTLAALLDACYYECPKRVGQSSMFILTIHEIESLRKGDGATSRLATMFGTACRCHHSIVLWRISLAFLPCLGSAFSTHSDYEQLLGLHAVAYAFKNICSATSTDDLISRCYDQMCGVASAIAAVRVKALAACTSSGAPTSRQPLE